ncbi:MAG: hypothetical protein ACU0CX_19740 [Sagittula sp.]|uniref:hypothetical protein n=1 Tax=Sagittula sp. TaxID=2038081 RepID=UPI004059A931
MVLYSGGHLRIDNGRPMPGEFDATLRNLREVPTNLYLNTPGELGLLVEALATDRELRATSYRVLKLIYCGGAVLPQHAWRSLDTHAVEETGRRVMINSGVDCTEAGRPR